jgi:hypothetical protein
MWFRSLFDTLLARPSRTSAQQGCLAPNRRRRPRPVRLLLEALEDRALPSTYTVNALTDTGAGSGLTGDLRYCITNATSGSDAITFGVTGTINLESALPALNTSVVIQGPGAGQLTVEHDPSSNSTFGIFTVGSTASVQISGLTIADGNGTAIYDGGGYTISGGAIYNSGILTISNSTLANNLAYSDSDNVYGGAIYNAGALTVSNSTLANNAAESYYNEAFGGAVYNAGALTVSNSTLANNAAKGLFNDFFDLVYNDASGGAIYSAGALTVSNSTLANNLAESGSYDAFGGGVCIAGGTASIDHSTLAGNQAAGGSVSNQALYGYGGGIWTQSALQVYDTIVADNTADLGPDLGGSGSGGFTSLGHNLIGNNSGSGYAASDLVNVNPDLGPLQNNGGPTQIMALLSGSPAINAGDNTNAPASDQRGPGFPRVFGGAIDIGAFEAQNLTGLSVSGFPSVITAGNGGSFTVTAINPDGTTDTGYTGTVHFASSDGHAVLPAAYTYTVADAGVHTFSATLKTAGTQSITATDTTIGAFTGTDRGITVNPATASSMSVAGFPTPATAGVAGNVAVTLKDPYGNIARGYTGTVHFTSSDARVVLPANYTFTATDAGAHTFSTTLKTAGTQSLTATDTVTASLTGTDGGIKVTPAAASQFILTAPSSVTAGASFSLTLTVEDGYGNVVTGYTGAVHFSSTETRATLPSNYMFTTTDKGVHTFTGLVLRKQGNQKITLTDTHNSLLTGSAIVDVL